MNLTLGNKMKILVALCFGGSAIALLVVSLIKNNPEAANAAVLFSLIGGFAVAFYNDDLDS